MAAKMKYSDFLAFELGLRLAKIEPKAGLAKRVELLEAVAAGVLVLNEPADLVAKLTNAEDVKLVQKNSKDQRARDQKVAKIILMQVQELF